MLCNFCRSSFSSRETLVGISTLMVTKWVPLTPLPPNLHAIVRKNDRKQGHSFDAFYAVARSYLGAPLPSNFITVSGCVPAGMVKLCSPSTVFTCANDVNCAAEYDGILRQSKIKRPPYLYIASQNGVNEIDFCLHENNKLTMRGGRNILIQGRLTCE
jgi:hypothetical protein